MEEHSFKLNFFSDLEKQDSVNPRCYELLKGNSQSEIIMLTKYALTYRKDRNTEFNT